MASVVSNINSANALHNSVLPTPVGPRNKNEPLGRLGSDNPALERRIALLTAFNASSWPTTRLLKYSSIRNNLSRSPSIIFETGMPVHLETTSAISSSVTLLRNKVIFWASAGAAIVNCFSKAGIIPYCNSDIRAKSLLRLATSRSVLACSSFSLISAEPCKEAFSAFQISSRSEYSFSRSPISSSRISRRFLEAASCSFLSATCSIFNWIKRR